MADESEAWKGDKGDDGMPRNFLEAMFGRRRELTPEEKIEYDAKLTQLRANAEVRALMLSRYSHEGRCVKCHGTRIRTGFCNQDFPAACFHFTAGKEHMHRVCKRCGFTWYELPLDAA